MADPFDHYATTSEDDNPLSLIDSAPTAITATNDISVSNTDVADDEHDTADSESSFEEEDYPMDYLDTEGWNNRTNRCSSDDNEDDDDDASSEQQDDMTRDIGGTATTDNRRRGLFPWRNRRSSKYEDTATDNYTALPSDSIDPPSLDNHDDSDDIDEQCHTTDNEIRPGDHIYVWQTYGINPRAYQRHAVVVRVDAVDDDGTTSSETYNHDYDDDDDHRRNNKGLSYNIDNLYRDDVINNARVTVVTFYQLQRTSTGSSHRGTRSGCQTQTLHEFIGADGLSKQKPIRKVRYGAELRRGILNRKHIVGTALKQDEPGLVLARIRYLLDNPNYLPAHNALSANGECAAMWCVTGRWCTLQGASILQITCVGQASGALVAGGILSNLTVLAPMPGLWGLAGWWWYVPATVAYPFLVPVLVALGMCSLVPLEVLRRNRKKWRGITDGLNHEFWSVASEEIKDEYFGRMANAEREAEMRSFFGVREGEDGEDDAKYMPLGGTPGGLDEEVDSDEEVDEALALQKMERRCESIVTDMDVDLSGKPPSRSNSNKKGWGSLIGTSFRRRNMTNNLDESKQEKESILS